MPSKPAWPLSIWLASWGGSGFSPVAPGTAGSLGAILVAWPLLVLTAWPAWTLAVAALLLLLPGVWASNRACEHFGEKDPQAVVVDEVLGQWLTLAAAPGRQWKYWLAGLALFRLFDIWKPFPARAAERLPGGWGIVADDLVAGVYGAVVLFGLRWLNSK
ncbi:MAG: phosphatidylglycerophosphatase A [Acidobacteria bacterium]|nr:phosphatidylglycerophosphatase A [Acidobacteriota bacterium]